MLSLILALATLSAPQGISYHEFEQEVIDYSIKLSRSMEQSSAMYHASQAARTDFFPSVDSESSYQYNLASSNISMGGEKVALKHYSYSLSTSIVQPVLSGGKIRNTYEAAVIKAQMAEENVQQTLDDIVHQAQAAYWGAAAKKDLYGIACRYASIIEQFTATLKEKYEAGAIGRTDLLQMQTRMAEAQLQRSSVQLAYRQSIQAMNTLMGRQPDSPTYPSDSIGNTPPMPFAIDLGTALILRSDFAMDSLQTEYQKRQVSLAAAQYNPSLSVGIQQQWGTPLLNTSGTPKFSPVLFAKVRIPMFHWGKRAKSVAAQRALLNDAIMALSDKYDQINLEVATTLTAVQESRKQIDYAAENCRLAQANLDVNTFSYTEGRLTILDVLSAQLTWLQAHTNLTQAHYNYRIAIADYRHATGSD